MNYIGHVSFGGRLLDVTKEQVEQWTSDYIHFLHDKVCQGGQADVAVVHLGATFIDRLINELTQDGEVRVVLNENRAPTTADGVVVHYVRYHRATCLGAVAPTP